MDAKGEAADGKVYGGARGGGGLGSIVGSDKVMWRRSDIDSEGGHSWRGVRISERRFGSVLMTVAEGDPCEEEAKEMEGERRDGGDGLGFFLFFFMNLDRKVAKVRENGG